MYRGIFNVVSYLRNSVTDGGGQLGGLTAFSLAFKCLSRPSEGSSSVLPDSLAGEFKGYGLPLPCECLKRLRNPRLTTLERVDENPLWRGAHSWPGSQRPGGRESSLSSLCLRLPEPLNFSLCQMPISPCSSLTYQTLGSSS